MSDFGILEFHKFIEKLSALRGKVIFDCNQKALLENQRLRHAVVKIRVSIEAVEELVTVAAVLAARRHCGLPADSKKCHHAGSSL